MSRTVPRENLMDNTPISARFGTFGIFILVGGLSAGIYYGLLVLLFEIFRSEYYIGVSVAYVFAISFHFFASRVVTFKATHEHTIHQLVRYLVLAGFNYLLTLIVVTLGIKFFTLNAYWSALIALSITTVIGFVASRNWIFGAENK